MGGGLLTLLKINKRLTFREDTIHDEKERDTSFLTLDTSYKRFEVKISA